MSVIEKRKIQTIVRATDTCLFLPGFFNKIGGNKGFLDRQLFKSLSIIGDSYKKLREEMKKEEDREQGMRVTACADPLHLKVDLSVQRICQRFCAQEEQL